VDERKQAALADLARVAPEARVVYCGAFGRCSVIVTDEPHEYGVVRHASIAHPWRYPTWEEIVQVRDQFFGPDTECVMFIPSRKEHVNLHPNAFHLWGDPQGRRRWVLADEVPGTT